MATMSKDVLEAWENREGPAILATVDANGVPNIIYVTCVGVFNNVSLVVKQDRFFSFRKKARPSRSKELWNTMTVERFLIS